MAGKFITLEGIDGAGKSSHTEFLASHIRAAGHDVLTTREPGGTALGESLRTLLLHEKMQSDTEVLLMFASRCEQLATVIEPALRAGQWVICDRFTDSTYAYQCGGRGLDPTRVAAIEQWVHGHIQPDLTFLFDAPINVARERLNKGTISPDKFEREQDAFFTRVREAYLARAKAFPARIKLVDSSKTLADIRAALTGFLDNLR